MAKQDNQYAAPPPVPALLDGQPSAPRSTEVLGYTADFLRGMLDQVGEASTEQQLEMLEKRLRLSRGLREELELAEKKESQREFARALAKDELEKRERQAQFQRRCPHYLDRSGSSVAGIRMTDGSYWAQCGRCQLSAQGAPEDILAVFSHAAAPDFEMMASA